MSTRWPRVGDDARRPIDTRIEAELCNGCGLCVEDCPAHALSMVDGVARVTGTETLGCDHCAAICPTGAVTVGGVGPEMARLETLDVADDWIRPGKYPAAELVQLMRSRRSCREFKDEPVDEAVLRDLARIGTAAPSASNWQPWTFTLLPDRSSVLALRADMVRYYKKLNGLAARRIPRLTSRYTMKGDPLGTYAAVYLEKMTEWIRMLEEEGVDTMFHGAPAAIVVGRRGTATSSEDALLATENILLAAHAMGYGTCLNGFAVGAMQREAPIKTALGIPEEEAVHAVIALGRGKRRYQRTTGRLDAPIRVARR